ncbi:MAG: hypothetical protein FWH38_08190 [Treponema sp.]|nr:hypothetical protein [Treponema sp.]
MRNLVLLLIVLFAVVTFIRAFDTSGAGTMDELPRQAAVEARFDNRR